MTPGAGAARVLEHALRHPPRLGSTRLVCVDGPSGSGKSTLAAAIERTGVAATTVLATDELLPGWDGLPSLVGRLEPVLRALAAGREGWWRRWDWQADRWDAWHRVQPGSLVVVEGVGAGAPAWADLVTTLAWVEAPRGVRLARGLRRDDQMAGRWRRWQAHEDALHVAARTRARADLRLATG